MVFFYRELNHSITNQIPSLDLRTVSPDEEVAQLINKDLPEEEDDDEYNPDDDDECHVRNAARSFYGIHFKPFLPPPER